MNKLKLFFLKNEIQSHPSTSKNLYSTRTFSSSTPTLTPNRPKILGSFRNSSPYNFSEQALNSTEILQQHNQITTAAEDNGENSTDEEVNINDDVVATETYPRGYSRKRLNISSLYRPSMRTSLFSSRDRYITKDDDVELDTFNGTPNESASESEDSTSRIT